MASTRKNIGSGRAKIRQTRKNVGAKGPQSKSQFTGSNLIINPNNYPAVSREEALNIYTDIKNSFNLQNIHWGQLKLFYSEVIFLNMCMKKYNLDECVCVYAGAAPGHHNFILRTMYPDLRWILVDPAPFVAKEDSHIAIFNEFFTNDFIKNTLLKHHFVKDRKILFISDIRLSLNVDTKNMDPAKVYKLWERAIIRDNAMQQEWAITLGSRMAMLKFHIPMYEALEAKSKSSMSGSNSVSSSKTGSKLSKSTRREEVGRAGEDSEEEAEYMEASVSNLLQEIGESSMDEEKVGSKLVSGGGPLGYHYQYDLSSVRSKIANPEILENINYNMQYPYLEGTIFKQLYAPRHSTETRLICEAEADGKYRFKVYNAELYTRQLYHFNIHERLQEFIYRRSNVLKFHIIGMNDLFCPVAEYYIIDQYLTMLNKYSKSATKFTQSLEVIKMMYMIHRNISKITGKTLIMCGPIDILKQVKDTRFKSKYGHDERREIIKYLTGQFNQLWASINRQIKFFEVPKELILEEGEYDDQIQMLKKSNIEINKMKKQIFKELI